MRSVIVIPARLGSTRLPRKMLLRETGKTLIQHTYQAAQQSKKAEQVIVATDSQEIFDEVTSFGGNVKMTRADHVCGTDRVAEVAEGLDGIDIVLNLQGDEPEMDGDSIDLAIELLEKNPETPMSTLAVPIASPSQLNDPNCVKVVMDHRSQALYFSRAPIPYPRRGLADWPVSVDGLDSSGELFFQHIGVYGYRREFVLKVPKLAKVAAEAVEMLEQLRVLVHGYSIIVGKVSVACPGVDTEEDYQSFVSRITNC